MKTTNFIRSSFIVKAAFFILLSMTTATVLNAQTVTFAQFFERNGTNDFIFTNQTTSASFSTITNGSPIFFTYQNVAGLPAELQGIQFAHIFVTANTTAPAFLTGTTPPRAVQPFNQTFTIQIIRDTPATSGTGTRRNLLTAVVSPSGISMASMAGDDTSNAAAFTASSSDQVVTYTSDFLGFLATTSRNLGLSFSSINPTFTIGTGGFLSSFTAAGTGTFASNPAPIFNPPTASNVSIGGRVLLAGDRGLANVPLTLTDSNGETQVTYTNSLGRFVFEEVQAGQIVTISVISRRYSYAPQVIDVSDNIDSLTFLPQ